MIIEAEFIGQDKRLKRFEKYKILFSDKPKNKARICIDNLKSFECPYQSIQSFLKNWNNIKIITL